MVGVYIMKVAKQMLAFGKKQDLLLKEIDILNYINELV